MPDADIRLFNCARCHCQVKICRYCDRGNIYCGPACSIRARSESLRAAGKRYQCSLQGRIHHALRQGRYRLQANKVTHQGSTDSSCHDLLALESRFEHAPGGHETTLGTQEIQCDFCQRRFGTLIRLNFLHRNGPRHTPPPWTRSPPDV